MTWQHAIAVVWLAVGATVVGGIVAGIRRYGALLVAKESSIKNTTLRSVLENATWAAESAATTIVESLNQTTTTALKAQGKWDAAAAASVKAQAMALLKGTLPADALKVLQQAIPDLPAFLSALIEAAVASAPNKSVAGAPAVPAPVAPTPVPAPPPTWTPAKPPGTAPLATT